MPYGAILKIKRKNCPVSYLFLRVSFLNMMFFSPQFEPGQTYVG